MPDAYKPATDGRQHVAILNMDRALWRLFRTEAFRREIADRELMAEILRERYEKPAKT